MEREPADRDAELAARLTVVRRYAEEVWNAGRFDVCEELFRGGHTYHDPLVPLVGQGPEGVRQHHVTYAHAFPDGRVTIEELLGVGDRVVARWSYTGTHLGSLKGIAPTGRRVHTSGMHLFRFVRGQVAETWAYWDALGLFEQLGVVTPISRGSHAPAPPLGPPARR